MVRELIADWRATPQFTPLAIILLAVPLVFFSTTVDMVNVWLVNETFTHGFLILPISLWLIWGQREHVRTIATAPDWRALLLMALAIGVWLAASMIDVAAIQQLAMISITILSVWLILGPNITLALLFPLLYLFFAVPLGQSLIPPMMEFTADFSVAMVQLSGVPIFRDGLSFQLPTGSWSVVEECSGVRYLIASAALGTIYSYITYRSLAKRSLFIAASLIVPILANGLRAYGIVMIGHLSGMKYAVGADHLLYGWVFFGIVIFALFWFGGFWADSGPAASSEENPASAQAKSSHSFNLLSPLLAALLVINLAVNAVLSHSQPLPDGVVLKLPRSTGIWRQLPETSPSWNPIYAGPDLELSVTFARFEDQVQVDIGYFHSQRRGSEAISSLNRLTDPYEGEWNLIADRELAASGTALREAEVARGGVKRLVWTTYLVDGGYVANPYVAKLLQAQALLVGDRTASVVTLSTAFDDSLPALRDRLANAWGELSPIIIQATRDVVTTNTLSPDSSAHREFQ